jgi:L-fuculose-phosphate aldolase
MNIHKIKQEICDIGKRIYEKGFAAANDGNISYRAGENQVVCTPTLVCKGFLTPDDLCIVDMQGKQIGGRRKHTSEVKLHLTIMKERPEIKAIVHCHPPHATAFGIAREPIPQCVLPEVEIFLGSVPIAKYATPGSQEFADTILPFVHKANVIVLANHGTVSFGETVERAYWWTEILDAYCRILLLARGLGRVNYFSESEAKALLDLKGQFGMKDPRSQMKNCELCSNDVFRESWKDTGVCPTAFASARLIGDKSPSAPAASSNGSSHGASTAGKPRGNADQETLIQAITDRVMEMLRK